MSLFFNSKNPIPRFKVGYPTESDKYNVYPAVLQGTDPVHFGDMVMFGDTAGYYKKVASASAVGKLAGFVLATNVKLADYPSGDVKVYPGEAFNLVAPNSYLAVKLNATAVLADIVPNAGIKVYLSDGTLTTSSVTTNTTDLPNVVFTGKVEKHGDDIVAEIFVK